MKKLHSLLCAQNDILKTFGEVPSGPAALYGLLNSLRICSLVQTRCELLPNASLFT